MNFSDQYIRLNRANFKVAELGASIQGWINKTSWSIEAKIDKPYGMGINFTDF